MSQLTDRRAGVDVVATNLSLGIPIDQDFIGDQLFPTLMEPLSTVQIPVWGTEAFRIREDKVGDYSEPDKLDISIDKTLFKIDGHALMAPVSRRHQLESTKGPLQIDLDREVLETIVYSMALARERAQAILATTASVYAAGHTSDLNALSARWDDASVDPMAGVVGTSLGLIDAIETTVPDDAGRRPNVGWFGQQAWAKFIANPFILKRIFGQVAPQGVPTTAQVAALLGLDKVLVGRALSKTVGGVNTKLWGKDAGLMYIGPGTGKRNPSFGRTVEQDVFNGSSRAVTRWPDEKIGASGGDWMKQGWFYTPVVTFRDGGYLYKNVVA